MHTKKYIDALHAKFKTGKATEHTYRPPFENYLHSLLPEVEATNEQKRQACGMPDFVLTQIRKKQPIDVGYIEAKDIGVNLDKVEKSDQMKRYLKSLDNLILTDYLEFRFYREQKKVATVRIAEVDDFFRADGATIKPLPENFAALENLLHDFVEYKGQTIKSARTLAEMMARKAQLMRDVFEKALADTTRKSNLHDQLAAFRKILIHDMDEAQFSDVYAQTIAYGLFTARLHDDTLDSFSRAEALELIPLSNPFLRKLFQYVSLDLDHTVVWIVDALCEVFRAANVHDILHDFGKQSGRNDPVVHFYETFLAEYDPKLRKARGVWYTPEPVVNFIVRAVDEVLKTHFGLKDGIADTSKVQIEVDDQHLTKKGTTKKKIDVHKVQLLDVAAGTGTFTAEAIKQIHQRFAGMQGMWSGYVEEHLLPRLHGFEILMASYAMCHLKIDLLLSELGYKPKSEHNPPRVGVYLTNALEEHHPDADTLFASWLANEANEANRIKRDMPIMVAYGNPPYSVSSQNKGEWIEKLMQDYKRNLNERNINPLSDDYIKFIRYAAHYIEKTGHGVVAMITNNSFLDGIIHRQMRKQLLETFDHIYVVDLHGSAKKKETAPDGSPDKNVFDIMQGVCISILVKDGSKKRDFATLHHQDVYGSRKAKYEHLWQEVIQSKCFAVLPTPEPYYFFVPKDFGTEVQYCKGFKLGELCANFSGGVQTKRDKLFTDEVKVHLFNRIEKLLSKDFDHNFSEEYEVKDSSSYPLLRKLSQLNQPDESKIVPFLYRTFDTRFIYYDPALIGRAFYKIMQHMQQENLAILALRNSRMDSVDNYFLSNIVTNKDAVSSFDNCHCFPLYLYPDTSDSSDLLAAASDENNSLGRKPNLDGKIVATIAKKLNLPFVPDHEPENLKGTKYEDSMSESALSTPHRAGQQAVAGGKHYFTPLDLLDYIYAVLHSPSYRETYKEFLKIDFPRVPYPDNAATFWQLAALGSELRQFHLLEHPALAKPITTFPQDGDCVVEKPLFKDGKVHINATQYFDGVPEEAWNFYIGGYQPAQKWLKDRKTRTLNFEDVRHYQKIIVALMNTNRLMKEIDATWQP